MLAPRCRPAKLWPVAGRNLVEPACRWRHLVGLGVGVVVACGPATPPPRAPVAPPSAVLATPAPTTPRLPTAPDELSDDVTPIAYRVELEVDPSAKGYRGTIEIDVDVGQATRTIWLHAAPELTATPTAVTRDGQALAIEAAIPASAGSIVGVMLRDQLGPGPVTLRFEIAADYRDHDGVFAQRASGQRFVYTDFEPVDARRAWPCFDLPRWRAPWTVTIRTPDGVGAYGNTPELSATREGDQIAHRFATTAPLPSYLVAFAVGRFQIVDVPDAPIPTRVLVPGSRGSVALAAKLLGPVLDASVRTIGRPNPWPKLDLVVVPIMNGAMENPGLITIAWSIATAPQTDRAERLLAWVIAHEVAHLWFGDWVTVTEWRELWLNEGIATWQAHRTLAALDPRWRRALDRVDDRLAVSLEDRVAGVHPLRPRTIDEPRALFDHLTYDKGATVMHTLDAWLGADRVSAAMADHLDRHAWGAASSDDLIASLAAIDPGLPIADVVRDAVELPGLPEVTAEIACAPDRATLIVRGLEPARRTVVCARWGGKSAGRACVVTGNGPAPVGLGTSCPTWLVPDDDGGGYYRWQLDAPWWKALARAPLAPTELRVALDAAMDALGAGQTTLDDVTPLLLQAIASADRRLLEPAARWVRVLVAIAPDGPRAQLVQAVGLATDRVLAKLGRAPVANDAPDRAEARALALMLAGTVGGDRKAVRWADKTTAAWLRGAVQPDLVTTTALDIVGVRGSKRRRAELLAVAGKPGRRSDAVNVALGRAIARFPDDDLAPLLAPELPASELMDGIFGALLEDPRRAERVVPLLHGRAAIIALFATGAPCALPAAKDLPANLIRLRDRLAISAAQCQALVARAGSPGL